MLCTSCISGCGVIHAIQSDNEYAALPLFIGPDFWFLPPKTALKFRGAIRRSLRPSPRVVPNLYESGKATEEEDLNRLWDKVPDTIYSTSEARAAADRLFLYGSFRNNESLCGSRLALESYLGRSADSAEDDCLTYILYSLIQEERHQFRMDPEGIQYRKEVLRRSQESSTKKLSSKGVRLQTQ